MRFAKQSERWANTPTLQDVSNFSQPTSPYPAPVASDDYAAVLARRLGQQPPAGGGAWGLFTTVILGLFSFGVLPLLIWPSRFREYVSAESRAMQELAEWARIRGRRPAAVGPLLAAAEDASFRPLPWVTCLLLAVFVVGVFVISFVQQPVTYSNLLSVTYYFNMRPTTLSQAHATQLHKIWVAVLSVGYLLHWVQVRSHLADVRRFVARFNPVIESEFLPTIRLQRTCGMGIMWIVAAFLMGCYGVWWGIPMLMAGAVQRRYIRTVGRELRHQLTLRLTDIAAQRRLPVITPPRTLVQHQCPNNRCLAILRPEARFCTRCGTPA
jgi:hypothetical protein